MELVGASTFHLSTLQTTNYSPETIRRYGFTHRLFIGWVSECLGEPATLAALTRPNVQAFVRWLQTEYVSHRKGGETTRGMSDTNVAQRVADLKAWSHFLAENGSGLPSDPLTGLRKPKTPTTEVQRFTPAQIKLLADLCETTRERLRNRAIVLFLAETGVRVTELCTLRLEHVEPATTKRAGRARVLGKGSKQRYVHFGVRTWLAVTKYLELRRKALRTHEPFVFVRTDGRPLHRTAVEELIRDLGARAGLPPELCHPHAARHCFGTEYLRAHPGQLEQLRILMGHSTLTQVTVYARLAAADVEGSWSSLVDEW